MAKPTLRIERDIALSRGGGIEGALESRRVDTLIAPMTSAAKCSGKAGTPIAAVTLGPNAAGAPFGVTFHSRRGEDAKLLVIAHAVEQAIGERMIPAI